MRPLLLLSAFVFDLSKWTLQIYAKNGIVPNSFGKKCSKGAKIAIFDMKKLYLHSLMLTFFPE
jgi:hypothetical protein